MDNFRGPEVVRFFVTLVCFLLFIVYSDDILETVFDLEQYIPEPPEDDTQPEADEDEFRMHMVTDYGDLLPVQQFTLLNFVIANVGRNESNLMLDPYL